MAESVKSKHEHIQSPLAVVSHWRWPWVLFTLLVFSSLIKLGLWQWQRADEKFDRLHRMQELTQSQPLQLNQVNYELTEELLNDVPIRLSGEFVNAHIFLLDNQTNKGKTGYRVFIPFNDALSGQHILVNLGWIAGSIDRSIIPDIANIKGLQEFTGHVRVPQAPVFHVPQTLNHTWPQRVQHIDPQLISDHLKINLAPVVIYLDPEVAIGYKKNWHPIVMPPEKHRGYAWQWFSLAVAFLSLMIWAAHTNKDKNKDKNKGSDHEPN
ncbi:SURF1 family protein [Thalassotalea litorea]|uniref:SURF1-like protein n=1 Tax=Thalassotalea litorea TaxID=2020715 RepID=A0A5R9IKN8_9GAMM|nr:SURF1 family protein [Thalassotalea litorea]TLU64637.1 SURF1 family protein [Thalassotalea litorea]